MFRYMEERSNKIIEGDGVKFLKENYIFLDNNMRSINLESKIEKENKKNNLCKIKVFENTSIPKSFQIKKGKRLIEFFCVNKEVIKRFNLAFEYLRDNGLAEDLIKRIEKKKTILALSVFQSEKFIKEEKKDEDLVDNCLMIESFISAILRNIYEESQEEF